jgi:hypothetical protein
VSARITKLRRVPFVGTAAAKYKAWMLEREAAHTAQHYAEYSQRHGLIVPAGKELLAALDSRLAVRRSQLGWPKPVGELNIFLVYPLWNWEVALPGALAPFGRVTQFEWRSRGFDESASNWLTRRDSMNAELLQAFHAANQERPIDVVVGYLSGNTVAPEVLLEMAAHGAVITNFCFDDKIEWPGAMRGGRYTSPAAIAHAVDLNLTSDPSGGVRYAVHGGLSLFHAEAADPESFRPLDLPFEYDVSFVGACYGWRPVLIEALRRAGIDVACFGKGWPNGPISDEQMNVLYAKSRVNLGFGGIGYSKTLLCLKGRDFEVPMSGAIYLTQDNPELSRVFAVGKEILTYRDAEDCARVIAAVLEDPDGARRIREAARARCLRDHTYRARWSTVFRTLGAIADAERGPVVS